MRVWPDHAAALAVDWLPRSFGASVRVARGKSGLWCWPVHGFTPGLLFDSWLGYAPFFSAVNQKLFTGSNSHYRPVNPRQVRPPGLHRRKTALL